MMATIPPRNEPRALERTLNHTTWAQVSIVDMEP